MVQPPQGTHPAPQAGLSSAQNWFGRQEVKAQLYLTGTKKVFITSPLSGTKMLAATLRKRRKGEVACRSTA